jgi:hypothetical protein
MKRDDDPDRLIRSPGENEGLRTLLSAGQGELPDAARLASLAAKLGPMMGPGGGGGGGGGAAAAKGTVAALGAATVGKVAVVLAVVAVGSVAAWRLGRSPALEAPVAIASPAPSVSSSPAPAPPPAPDETPSLVASGAGAGAGKSGASIAARPPPRPVDPDLEVKLLRRAQDSLATDPSAALALCGEHAQAFPQGLLAQEREVLAIDALVRLGRADEANARGRRFAATFPASTHLRRVEALLEKTRKD